jgi:high-affinity iron transporter
MAFQSFVITLREGLEAFLIVAISLAYLKKTGRPELISAVKWGIAISIAVSVAAGILLQQARNQALWEGVLAIVAAISVTTLIIHMWRTGRKIKANIEGRLASSAKRAGRAAFVGVLGFTILMITREGMETALLMNTLLFQISNAQLLSGAIAGTVAAAGVAWLWSRYGHRVDLGRFFQVTAVFLFVFVIQLVIYGFHELTEANIGIPNSEALHWATEPYGPDGMYGQYLTYLLVILPIGWLLISTVFRRRPKSGPPVREWRPPIISSSQPSAPRGAGQAGL